MYGLKAHARVMCPSTQEVCLQWRRHVLPIFFYPSCSENCLMCEVCVCVWWCRQCSVWRSVLCVVPQQVPTWTLSRRGHTQYSPCTFVSSALHSLKYAQWLYFIVMLCSSLSFEAFRTFCVHIVNSHLATVILFVHHVFRNFMHNESHKSI